MEHYLAFGLHVSLVLAVLVFRKKIVTKIVGSKKVLNCAAWGRLLRKIKTQKLNKTKT